MTDEFDAMFSGQPKRPSFTERLGGRTGPGVPEEPIAPHGKGYEAFGVLPSATISESCDVRFWVPGGLQATGIEFSYRLLLQVAYVGDDELRLHLPDSLILVEGRNLNDLRKKLMRRTVHYIQQYNANVWPIPPNDAAVVERIEIIRPETFKRPEASR